MIHLDRAQILARSNIPALVDALEAAFAEPFSAPERMHCLLPGGDGGTLLVMPAWQGQTSLGVKVVTVMPGNPRRGLPSISGVHILMDGETGVVQAILDASALTALRTSAVSALASRFLSRPDASSLLMVGTGALSEHLVRAHCAVRSIRRVAIWGRDPDKARALAARIGDLDVDIAIADDLADAVTAADIVSCATMSDRPLVRDSWVRPGCHVDLVGSFAPTMVEVDPRLLGRSRLVVDTQVVLKESGDLIAPLRDGIIAAPAVELSELAAGSVPGRSDPAGITVFKSVGTGLADIAAARHLIAAEVAA